jgi:hypothetical protein
MISVQFSQKELERGIDSMVAGRTGVKAKAEPVSEWLRPHPAASDGCANLQRRRRHCEFSLTH